MVVTENLRLCLRAEVNMVVPILMRRHVLVTHARDGADNIVQGEDVA